MTNQLTAAYVAGLIDGEGCIYTHQRKGYYSSKVEVGMTEPALPILRRLHRRWGGALYQARAATERWATAHSWAVQGPPAAVFLREIQPFLTIKEEQARLAIRLEDIKESLPRRRNGSTAWTDHARWHCDRIQHRIKELNAKGPTVQEPTELRRLRVIARLVAGSWVTDQADLFSDLGWAPFSGTWPASGMTRGGVAYELPTPMPRMAGSECSLPLLPTPRVSASRTSRGAAVRRDSMAAPSLEQAIEIANGQLPREFTSWSELPPSWHGDLMSPPSGGGS